MPPDSALLICYPCKHSALSICDTTVLKIRPFTECCLETHLLKGGWKDKEPGYAFL